MSERCLRDLSSRFSLQQRLGYICFPSNSIFPVFNSISVGNFIKFAQRIHEAPCWNCVAAIRKVFEYGQTFNSNHIIVFQAVKFWIDISSTNRCFNGRNINEHVDMDFDDRSICKLLFFFYDIIGCIRSCECAVRRRLCS